MSGLRSFGFMGLSFFLLSPSAGAVTLTPTTLSGLNSGMIDDMIRTDAAGADYRSMMPASTLNAAGIDLGIDVVALTPPSSFTNAVSIITGVGTSSIPSLIPIPRVSIRKGLPFNLTAGMSFMPQITYQGNSFQMWGGELMWTFLDKPLAPVVAFRMSANYSNLWFLDSHSYRAEFVGSKKFGAVEPFFTLGYQFWNGSLDLPVTLSAQLPTFNLTGVSSGSNLALGLGMQFKLLFMKLSAEYNYYFTGTGIQTIGARLAILSF